MKTLLKLFRRKKQKLDPRIFHMDTLDLQKQFLNLAISNMQSSNAAREYGDEENALIYKGRANAFEEAAELLSGKKQRKRN